jgi:hypothetical protein
MQQWICVSLVCIVFSSCSKEQVVTEEVEVLSEPKRVSAIFDRGNGTYTGSQNSKSSKEERIESFLVSLESMNADEISELINDPTTAHLEILRSHKAVRKVFKRLGELDPQLAFELSKKMPLNFRMIATHHLFISWGKIDYEEAIEVAHSLSKKSLTSQAVNGAIIGLVTVEPDRAYKMAVDRDDVSFLREFFDGWSEIKLLAAYNKTQEIKNLELKEWIVSSMVYGALYRKDTEGVMELLHHSVNSDDRLLVLGSLNTNWQALDQSIMDYLKSLSSPQEKELAEKVFATQRIYADPELVANELLQELSHVGAELDLSDYNLPALMTAFSESDAEGARFFFEKLPSGSIKDQAYPFYLINLAGFNPDLAMQHILENDNIGHSYGHYSSIGGLLMEENGKARIEQALKSDSSNADFLVSAMYNSWPFHDLPAASAYLEQIDPEYENISVLYGKVAGAYLNSPEDGLLWLETIQNEKHRNVATDSFVDRWAMIDIDAATRWVNTLEVNSQRDAAAKALANTLIGGGAADLAIKWAESIADEAVRSATLKDVFFYWNMMSTDDAKRWLEETDLLDGATKTKLRAYPTK